MNNSIDLTTGARPDTDNLLISISFADGLFMRPELVRPLTLSQLQIIAEALRSTENVLEDARAAALDRAGMWAWCLDTAQEMAAAGPKELPFLFLQLPDYISANAIVFIGLKHPSSKYEILKGIDNFLRIEDQPHHSSSAEILSNFARFLFRPADFPGLFDGLVARAQLQMTSLISCFKKEHAKCERELLERLNRVVPKES